MPSLVPWASVHASWGSLQNYPCQCIAFPSKKEKVILGSKIQKNKFIYATATLFYFSKGRLPSQKPCNKYMSKYVNGMEAFSGKEWENFTKCPKANVDE